MSLNHRAIVATVAAALTLTACGSGDDGADGSSSSQTSPRLVLTSDGAVTVLDAETLEPVGDSVPVDGFLRVNPAGDGEHAYVTSTKGFEVLATGASTGEDPAMTGLVFDGAAAGHVVLHDGRTTLFDDATGTSWTFDSDAVDSEQRPDEIRTVESEEAHHGVAIELSDGTFLTTIGDEESRSGVRHLDADGAELARSEECPGVHGEGAAADEHVMFGCEDGVLLFADGEFSKVDSPDEFGRIGNAYVTDESPIAIVDYKDDPDAEGVLLHRLGVVDTAAGTLDVTDLPEGVEYSWQGVERAEDGTAWLIGTDGSLHQVDESGAVTESIPVIDAWEGPAEWQDAHPYLVVHGGTAYVTEPASREIHAVDLASGDVVRTASLPVAPNEMTIAG